MAEYFEALDKVIESLASLARTFRAYPRILHEEKNHKFHKFMDKALYNILNHLDIVIGTKYLDLSKSKNNNVEINYFARVLITSCHEILNDSNKMIGKDIRLEMIEKLGEEEVIQIDAITKEMNQLSKNHLKELKRLRNNVFAHKLDGGLAQSNMINEIDARAIRVISEDIWQTQAKFIKVFTGLIKKL